MDVEIFLDFASLDFQSLEIDIFWTSIIFGLRDFLDFESLDFESLEFKTFWTSRFFGV